MLHICYCACTKRPCFPFRSTIWRHHRVSRPRFPVRRGHIGDLHGPTFHAVIGSLLTLPRKREGMFLPALVCVSVCLSVTTITTKIVDGFVPNFMRRFLEGKGRPSSCFVTIGRGMCMEVTVENCVNRRLLTYYTSNSRWGKCCQVLATKNKFRFRGKLYFVRVLPI